MRCSPRALAQHRTRRAIVLHTRMYLITPCMLHRSRLAREYACCHL